MLKRLKIRNFQKHYNRVFEFGRVTTFVGTNDVGKSSAMRALRWLATNQPDGTGFISWGKDTCIVTGEFADDVVVQRKKSAKDNVYSLGDKEFRAFGKSGVPAEINKALNMDDLNFQRQSDASFWFSLTGGQLSKELNQIVNLDMVDTALAFIASEVRKNTSAVSFTKSRLQQAETKQDELQWVLTADEHLQEAERLRSKYEALSSKRTRLQNVLDAIKTQEAVQREAMARVAGVDAHIEKIDAIIAETAIVEKRYQRLQEILEQLEQAKDRECRAKKLALESASELETKTQGRCPICGQKMS